MSSGALQHGHSSLLLDFGWQFPSGLQHTVWMYLSGLGIWQTYPYNGLRVILISAVFWEMTINKLIQNPNLSSSRKQNLKEHFVRNDWISEQSS